MRLVFSPTLCPDALLPAVLDLATTAGFTHLELFRAHTQSTPVHDDWSVPMVRAAIAAAGLTLSGFNIRNLTGRKADSDERNLNYNLRQLEWDIHLGRALGLKEMNTRGGARTATPDTANAAAATSSAWAASTTSCTPTAACSSSR